MLTFNSKNERHYKSANVTICDRLTIGGAWGWPDLAGSNGAPVQTLHVRGRNVRTLALRIGNVIAGLTTHPTRMVARA